MTNNCHSNPEGKSKLLPGNKILFVSAHPDDAEFGAGGTLARLIEEEYQIYLIVLSNPVESLVEGFGPETLIQEQELSANFLGIPSENIQYYNFPVRRFNECRQDILEVLVEQNKLIKPDVVFCNSTTDVHQDHSQCAEEVVRAFRRKMICFFDIPWNSTRPMNNMFIELKERHLSKKIGAIQCYKSQGHRRYADTEYIKGWAKVRGVYSDFDFAESFELASMSISSPD